MFKRFLLAITMMTLFVTSLKKQNDIFIVAEDDYIEWNSFEIEDNLL